MDNNKDKVVDYWGIFVPVIFLCLISSVFIGSSLLFILNISITKVHLIVFPIICTVIIKYILKKDNKDIGWKDLIIILILFYFVLAILAKMNNFIWDFSFDSRGYHQKAIISLKDGWNPFYELESGQGLWVDHYAKAPWIFAGTIFKLTNHIEYGKVLTTFIPLILMFLAYGICYKLSKGKIILSLIIAFAIGLNPINIAQSFTYYVDSLVGCYIIFLLLLIYAIVFLKEYKYFKLFILFNVVAFLCNIKFTGLVYSMAILFVYFIYVVVTSDKNKVKRTFIYLFSSFIIITFILGFNPYLTNTINKGHPFYPLAGEGKEDIMTNNMPENYRGDTEFGKFLKSLIAKPDQDNELKGYRSSIKGMIKIDKKALKYYSGIDSRLRGFGFYSVIFIPVSILAMGIMVILNKNKKFKYLTLGLIVAVFLTIMLGGEYWWARYVSFMWIIPVAVSFSLAKRDNKLIKTLGFSLALLLIFNSSIMIPYTLYRKVTESRKIQNYFFARESSIMKFSDKDNFTISNINKAKEFNIDYEIFTE